MSTQIGSIHYALNLDDKKFSSSLSKASSDVKKFSDDGENKFQNLGKQMSSSIISSVAKITAAIGGIQLGKVIIQSAADMEMLRSSMDVLTGSVEGGANAFKFLNEFAAKTPFETTDLADVTKTMLSFGISAKDSQKYLRMLGDVALGDKNKLKGLSLAFSQVQSTGRLMGQDLLQMINQGFNPLTIISKKTGKSMATLKDEMAAGSISAQMVADAFDTATKEGGLFYKGMEKGASTVSGLASTIKDNLMMSLRDIVGITSTGDIKEGGLFYYLKKGMESFIKVLDANKDKITAFFGGMVTSIAEGIKILIDFGRTVFEKVKPHLDSLIASIQYNLIPSLRAFWNQFGDNIMQLAKFVATSTIIVIIETVKVLANVVSVLTDAFIRNKEMMVVLGAAFITFKSIIIAQNIIGVIMSMTAAITAAGGLLPAMQLMIGALGSPLALGVAAAVASIGFLMIQVNKLISVYDQLAAAQGRLAQAESIGRQQDVIINNLKSGRITQEQARQQMAALQKRAAGGPVTAKRPYIVGEKGPELFVPSGSGSIMPNDKTSTVTATFTGPIYLQDKSAVDEFFARLSRNQELAQKGLATL